MFVSACGSTRWNSTGVNKPAVDVYLAGFEQGSGNSLAMYWKNGVRTLLTDSTHASIASGIAVSGSDVYVVGNDVPPGQRQMATLWKNGVATALTHGAISGYASGISISGSDVYVSGGEFDVDALGNMFFVAEYWKNGVPTVLSNMTAGAGTNAIFVSGTDVYVAGYQYVTTQTGPTTFTTNPVAMYWKNGVPVQLTDGLNAAIAYSIFVSGPNVYVSGYNCLAAVPNCGRAAYWVDGTLIQLPTINQSAAASITASGGNVYVADTEVSPTLGELAMLWTNGVPQTLSVTNNAASNAVAVSGGDVYVAGAYGSYATYFKNGGVETVQSDANTDASAFAIAVVPQ